MVGMPGDEANMMAMRQIAANAYERKMETLWKKHNSALRQRYLQNYSNYFQQLRNKARAMTIQDTNGSPLGMAAEVYSKKVRQQLLQMQQRAELGRGNASMYDAMARQSAMLSGLSSPSSPFSASRMGGSQSPPYNLGAQQFSPRNASPMAAQMPHGMATSPRSQVASPISSPNHNLQQVMLNRMAQQHGAGLSQGRAADMLRSGGNVGAGASYARQQMMKKMMEQQYREFQSSQYGRSTPPTRAPATDEQANYST